VVAPEQLFLYGTTTDVRSAMEAGVPIALGADWAPSGSKNLLGEMKIARLVSQHEHGFLSDRAIVEMVTCVPAKMIGWQSWLGSLEVGRKADLVAIAGKNTPPYTDLIDATEADLIAVLIDGRPRLGRADILDPRDPKMELVRVASTDFLIDLTEPNDDPLAGLRHDTAIAKLTYGLKICPIWRPSSEHMFNILAHQPNATCSCWTWTRQTAPPKKRSRPQLSVEATSIRWSVTPYGSRRQSVHPAIKSEP